MREIKFSQIPDAYRAQTLARAEEVYGREPEEGMDDFLAAEGVTSELHFDQIHDPERFVSEAEYNAATPAEWEALATVLDWEEHSLTL
jgi:hypothetical protein